MSSKSIGLDMSPSPNPPAQGFGLDLKGAVAVLHVKIFGDGVEFRRLDDVAAALLSLHLGDCAEIHRKDAGRYTAHFQTLSKERAAIKLQSLAEAVPIRFREEFGDQVRADITYVVGPPLRVKTDFAVSEYIETLIEQLEAEQRAQTAKWEGKVRTARREAALIFTPVWNSGTERTDLCRCVLDLSLRGGLIEQISDEAYGDEVRQIRTALDLMALRKTLLAIHKGKAQRNSPDMILPVSAYTTGNEASCAELLQQIHDAPDGVRKHVIVELGEDQQDTSLARVIDQLKALDVRSIVCTQWLCTFSAEIAMAGPWGLAADLAKVKNAPPDQWRWLNGMAKFARHIGANSIALNVRTPAVGQKALEAGVLHFSGSTIHAPGPLPRAATRLRPLQLHRGTRAA